MKKKLFLLPLCLLTLSVMACQNNDGNKSQPQEESQQQSVQPTSSEEKVTFEAYTLDKLHEARAAKTLAGLDKKYVSIKGKVTFDKEIEEGDRTLFIQNGKNAVEVNYDKDFGVKVGDAVEIKGQLVHTEIGEVGTIFLSAYTSVNADYDIKVVNEAIETETVEIKKEADLIEFDSSLASMNFTVTGNRTNAAFIGKLPEDDNDFIVAAKLRIAEKVEPDTYAVDDKVSYEGVFTYSGDSSARVIRYLDKAGLKGLK